MRILVTGGNGYVGRALTRHLYPDHEVKVVDMLRDGPLRFSEHERERFSFDRVDIRDFDAFRRSVEEFTPEVVIHLAAIHYIPECERHPDEAVSINTLGTINVLRALSAATRFVLASTAAVYAPEDRAHDEIDSAVGPMDVYGYTKLHAEQYVRYLAAERHLDARIVRLFNVVGPGETNPHLLPAILGQVLNGTRTLRLGNVTPKRDYVNVDDVARGFAAVALGEHVGPEGAVDVVNLGAGDGYSVTEVVDRLSEVIGETLSIEIDDDRVRLVDRPYLMAARGRILAHYGWEPRKTLDDSLRELWDDPDIPLELLQRS